MDAKADHQDAKPGIEPTNWRFRLGWAALFLACVGTLIRYTVRDRWLCTALLYYMTSPLVMVCLLAVAIGFLRRAWTIRLRVLLLVLAVTTAQSVHTQIAFHEALPSSPTDIRFVFWNVCNGRMRWERILAELQQVDADIIALAEACKSKDSQEAQQLSERFPNHDMQVLDRGLVLLSRISIDSIKPLPVPPHLGGRHGAFTTLKFESDMGTNFTLLLADIPSDLLLHRKGPIGTLVQLSDSLDGPCLIAGDLNTPVDSIFIDDLRERFQNAFEQTGRGVHTTWPMPFPLMALDHLWGNSEIEFVETRILRTSKSDHCPLVSTFRIR